MGCAAGLTLSSARSRQQICPVVPRHHCVGSSGTACAAGAQREPECLFGALGESVKEECLSKLLLIGERSLRLALSEYVAHYHAERNHQGKDNVLLFPRDTPTRRGGPVQCRERLGGLLRYYHQEAA